MTPNDYTRALDKALEDLEDRVQRRDLLNAEIAGFSETVRVLSNRIAMTPDKQKRVAQLLDLVDYATPSLADSVRTVLVRSYPAGLTAIEVRNALEEKGFNFDEFSNSLSACHAALATQIPSTTPDLVAVADGDLFCLHESRNLLLSAGRNPAGSAGTSRGHEPPQVARWRSGGDSPS